MLAVIAAIHLHQINLQGQTAAGSKTATATILDPTGITTTLPSVGTAPPQTRPAIVGDVYSVQPNGDVQGRIVGSNGAYETFAIVGASCIWAATGPTGMAFICPFAADIPNA